jgi:hypothetical protein
VVTLAPVETLDLIPPNRLRYRGLAVPVGFRLWLALRCVLASDRGRVSINALCRAVWGENMSVLPGTVRTVVYRCNRVLTRLEHPGRLGFDGGDVVLV